LHLRQCGLIVAKRAPDVRVLVTHPGGQHSPRLAAELNRRDALSAFYTSWAFSAGGATDYISRVLPDQWRHRLANRRILGVPSRQLRCRPVHELVARWRGRWGGDDQQIWHRRAEAFQRSIPNNELASASAVIGFDTAAWVLSERCAKLSVPLILDQSTPHPDSKISTYETVSQLYPDWGDAVETRRFDVRQAEQIEHDRAARIVAGSSFVQATLTSHGVSAAKVCVNPYGVDSHRFHVTSRSKQRPLRFLYVGAMRARKGVPLLIEAWRELKAAASELWLIGSAPKQVLSLLPDLNGLRYFGKVPHAEVANLMSQCDVFVFPSFFEGLALVILEAMACGLPVITTSTSGGGDVITQGQDGWIIEPGNLTQLFERMTYCLERPEVVPDMGRQARATAERFSWSAYGDRWMQILAEVCS
jgi:glycosyltransferase involved in cell wall biosynthesis